MAKRTSKATGPTEPETGPQQPVVLSTQNRAPLYHQIYLILRAKILDGEYGPQDFLPGERDLEAHFGVSRITAVRALNELASEGLVVRERGRGTRVQFVSRGIVARGPTRTAENAPVMRGSSREVFDALYHRGSAAVTVYDFNYVTAPEDVAEALQLKEGDLVQHAVRVWRFDGAPFNHIITYVPQDLGQLWSKRELQTVPLGTLFERNGVNITVVQEQVTATLADMVISQRLEVAAGSPILKIRRIAFNESGRPVEYLIGCYAPDRYQYEVTLPRKVGTLRKQK
ncbi:MAG: GntR family transcriptional regulator [Hyphomonadaceae bacterium]|nr:GntR family transcriptional regulator [Hyphomonadaceae bacterium]